MAQDFFISEKEFLEGKRIFSKELQEEISKTLKTIDETVLQKKVAQVTEKVDCTLCANCCKKLIPGFNDEDINRISTHLQITRKEFLKKYLKKNSEKEYEMKQAPCLFLKDNKCSIYEIRPEVCRKYPRINKKVNSYDLASNAVICPIVGNVF